VRVCNADVALKKFTSPPLTRQSRPLSEGEARAGQRCGLADAFTYTRGFMRRLTVMFLVLLNISFILMPFSTLHMHVMADHHVVLHSGHIHWHDHDVDGHDMDGHDMGLDDHAHEHHSQDEHQLSTLHTAMFDDVKFNVTDWSASNVVLCVLVAWFFSLPYLTAVLRPPAISRPFHDQRSYWHPPLRGPPAFSI